MTGEKSWIDQSGNDSNGECWPLHAAVAKALNGTIKPFDVYQGPYIYFNNGYHNKNLWLIGIDCLLKWYREDTGEESFEFWWNDEDEAIEAAKSLLLL